MKKAFFLLIALSLLAPTIVVAQNDEPDLAVSPARKAKPRRRVVPKVKTEEKTEPATPAPSEQQKKTYPGFKIDRENQKILTPKISFDAKGETLLPPSEIPLKKLAKILKGEANFQITIIAYTDSIGSDRENLERSEHEANLVRDFLVKEGVEASRLEAVGKGDSELVADDHTPLGQDKNRRVEFLIAGEKVAETQPVLEARPVLETRPILETQPPLETQPTVETRPALPFPESAIPVVTIPTIPTTPPSPETVPVR